MNRIKLNWVNRVFTTTHSPESRRGRRGLISVYNSENDGLFLSFPVFPPLKTSSDDGDGQVVYKQTPLFT